MVNGDGGRSATPEHGNNLSISTVNGHGCQPATPEYGKLYPFPR
ncbi:Variant surface antigen F (fragment) [Desulfamplus magnetovallimortis]|uniref:Variant surface antigen F n=1 Tax=Desulfamplus magnetovallimortis TaxID=1246637 RepID=A0A1W1H4R4_9BACT